MARLCLLLTATIYIFYCLPLSEGRQSQCVGRSHRVNISINSKRNESGEWVTRFSASQNTSVLPKNIDLDLSTAVIECQGNHFVNIQGIIKDNYSENENHRLYFHSKCSSNAVITNNGRTLQRKENDRAAALTNRPLLDNEIFTIRLDKKGTGYSYAFAIGITTHSPTTINVPNRMNDLDSGTWMFYHNLLFRNGTVIKTNYMKTSLDDTKVGQHIGVMRSKSGNLHIFLDGVDQGSVTSNITQNVYGAFELFGNAMEGTIID